MRNEEKVEQRITVEAERDEERRGRGKRIGGGRGKRIGGGIGRGRGRTRDGWMEGGKEKGGKN